MSKEKDPAKTVPSSPNSLEHGVRGRVTGVTRIGPRALGIGALVLFGILALIMIGANKKSVAPSGAGASVALATPNPQDTGHFGADEPIVAKFASAATRTPGQPSGLPPTLVLHTPAPAAASSDESAAMPSQRNVAVPDLEVNAAAARAAVSPELAQAEQLKLQRAQIAEQAREAKASARVAEIAAAQTAPILVSSGGGAGGGVESTVAQAAVPASSATSTTTPMPVPGASSSPNAFLAGPFGQYAAKTSTLQQGGTANAADYLDAQRYAPRGRYEIVASSIIPAELITGIDSEQPGLLSASVRQDVFDSRTGRYLLIPKGSKLIGVYNNQIQSGQTRILVAWERLIFPDTSSIDLHAQIGADTEGYSGLGGKVDNHFSSVFGAALLSSVITAGLQLSQPQQATTVNNVAVPSTGQILAGAAGQQVAQIGSQIVQKQLEIPPTIHVPRGYPFVVVVDRDMVLPGPYGPSS